MSVRQGLLALLAEQPMHGYQLRQQFEQRTGATWPLNIGQVYTTVQRLVRDGLVEPVPASADDADSDVERFRLSPAGRAEIADWWHTPVGRGAPARDELVIKLALAVTAPGVDAREVIQAQRTETMRALRDYTRLKSTVPGGGSSGLEPRDLAWSLVLDNLIFAAEAEVRWLDHVETRVARADAGGRTMPDSAESSSEVPSATATGGRAASTTEARR